MKINKGLVTREAGLLLFLVVICLVFGVTNEHFRDPFHFLDRSRHWVEIGMIAVPMTFIIATEGIDLSVGSLLAFCGIVAGTFFRELGWPLPLALMCAMLAGIVGGAFNGIIISLCRIPALVATLGSMALFRGLAMGISKANPIRNFPEAFTHWGSISTVGFGRFQIPCQTLILLAVVVLGSFVFCRTCIGRWSVQIGENAKAARFSNVPVNRTIFMLYAASGLACGVASIIYTSRFAIAHPGIAAGMELEIIACVVIGGTRISGGNGSVIGTFLGVLILGILKFGMDMYGILQQYQIILIGLLVITIAVFNERMARKQQLCLDRAGVEEG